MSGRLTVLIATMDAHGHTNAPIAIGQALLARGHRVVMETERAWKGRFQKYGIEEVYYGPEENCGGQEAMVSVVSTAAESFRLPWETKILLLSKMWKPINDMAMQREPEFKRIVEEIKPDVIIVDSFTCSPAHMFSGIPWIGMALSNPLFHLNDDRVPPPAFGLSSYENLELWPVKRELLRTAMQPQIDSVNAWLASQGFAPACTDKTMPRSPYGNIYMYPAELDYTDLRPIPPNFYRIDCLVRKDPAQFELPEKIATGQGLLVLASMGSHASADVELQKSLISKLAKMPHRFIICKGPFGDTLELPENVWGANFLPQTKILPLVDVFITHGGNNSLLESLFFGKPVIILPIFGDQPDNAQRVQETGYGVRLDAYNCTSEELQEAIEYLGHDPVVLKKYADIKERLQGIDHTGNAATIVENIARQRQV